MQVQLRFGRFGKKPEQFPNPWDLDLPYVPEVGSTVNLAIEMSGITNPYRPMVVAAVTTFIDLSGGFEKAVVDLCNPGEQEANPLGDA